MTLIVIVLPQIFGKVAGRTDGFAGPARYKSARAKSENEREAQGKKYPPVNTPLFMLFQPFARRTAFADWLIYIRDPRVCFQEVARSRTVS